MTSVPAFDFPQEQPTRVEPTLHGRIEVYDFIRGVAIFGILLANIPWFATPAFSEMATMSSNATGLDSVVEQWTTALVAGKFRSMLAILFGIGIWLQFQTRSRIPGNWPGGYLKRSLILAGFGMFHGLFIWFGDILFVYACVAFIACLFVGFSERVIRWIIGSALGLAGFGALVLMLIALLATDIADFGAGGGMGITEASERAAFMTGSYLDQLAIRGQMFVMMAASVLFFLPFLGALFLLGMLLARHEILAAPRQHPKTRNTMLAIGFGIGLPLNLMAGLMHSSTGAFLIESATEILFGPLLSIGLIMLLAIVAESGFLKSFQRALAKVGRMAFSNYILQSLICTTVFYSWGFGLFGELNRLELFYVVVGVWIVNLLFSHFWLARFQFGPLEWLWRSLTEGRRMPIRREGNA